MMPIEKFGLLPSTAQGIQACASGMRVKSLGQSDFPGWKDALEKRTRLLMTIMRKQNQKRNDCEGNGAANGAEAQWQYVTGEMTQFADMYAYQASERIMGRGSVGRDAGATIETGVIVRSEGIKALGVAPGLPLESEWRYDSYERDVVRFEMRAKAVKITNTYVAEHGNLPDFQQFLVCMAAGGVGHIGTYWPFRESAVAGLKLMDSLPTGGGGHCTEIIGAIRENGRWYLAVWNSHGYGAYLMSQKCYDQAQERRWAPFGGYLIMPDKPVDRYHDRRASGGGYV